jgi:UMF1 family MFS transporter
MYDWANSTFATTIMAGFFPLFFKKFWSAGVDVNLSTFQLGFANSASAAVLAIGSPILGAIADQGSGKKKFLLTFTTLGVVMTGALSLVARGEWQWAVALYVLASIGFAGANSFYDALLVFVSRPSEMNKVSALGFSLGYLGGGLLFAVNVLMTLKPHLFGLADTASAVRVSFVLVALWWGIFTLPMVFFVSEEKTPVLQPWYKIARSGLKQLTETFRELRRLKALSIFLLAYFFYIDAVNTIMRMAVDYGLSLGLHSDSLILALLITQFVAFPAAILFSQLAYRWGSKAALFLAIAVYCGVTVYSYYMVTSAQFYVLAVAIGLVQGGIQSVSRAVYGEMIPREKAGEFFGFFNMLGKFSSMLGPLLVGVVSETTHNSRLSILSILILFAIGAAFLFFADLPNDAHSKSART